MENHELKRDIGNWENVEARYDAQAKRFLSNKTVLAWIMHCCVPEYKDIDPKEIADKYIENPEISKRGVLPGESLEIIDGKTNEDCTPNEHKITYDIYFNATVPYEYEMIQLILNIEAQNKYNPGYPLESRGIYYCCRMISSQYGKDFKNYGYGKIKKVYSIWICTHPPKAFQNTISTYRIIEEINVGNEHREKKNYDLLSVIMICLGDSNSDNYDGILKFLGTLLSSDLMPKQKEDILKEEFSVMMTSDIKEENEAMCNLSQGVLEKGREQGIGIGREQGIIEMALEMHKNGFAVDVIAKITKTSVEQVKEWIADNSKA